MLKTLKFNGGNDTDYVFSSDFHRGHNRPWIVDKRGYKTVQEHDDGLIHNCNSVCTERTTLFHLGDLTFNDSDATGFWSLMRRLRFSTFVHFWGNHHSGARQAYLQCLKEQFPDSIDETGELIYEVYPLCHNIDDNPNKRVMFVPQYAEVQINGYRLVLCHYAFRVWNESHKSVPALYGHSHGSLPDDPNALAVDIGVDYYPIPQTLQQVKKIMSLKNYKPVDHHAP